MNILNRWIWYLLIPDIFGINYLFDDLFIYEDSSVTFNPNSPSVDILKNELISNKHSDLFNKSLAVKFSYTVKKIKNILADYDATDEVLLNTLNLEYNLNEANLSDAINKVALGQVFKFLSVLKLEYNGIKAINDGLVLTSFSIEGDA